MIPDIKMAQIGRTMDGLAVYGATNTAGRRIYSVRARLWPRMPHIDGTKRTLNLEWRCIEDTDRGRVISFTPPPGVEEADELPPELVAEVAMKAIAEDCPCRAGAWRELVDAALEANVAA